MNEREPSYLQVVEMLLRYHWGTVVGGALILPYFYFVDLLFDFIFVLPTLSRPNLKKSRVLLSTASPSDTIENSKSPINRAMLKRHQVSSTCWEKSHSHTPTSQACPTAIPQDTASSSPRKASSTTIIKSSTDSIASTSTSSPSSSLSSSPCSWWKAQEKPVPTASSASPSSLSSQSHTL